MARTPPKPSIFSTDEEEWMGKLSGLLAEDAQRILWLSFDSKPLSLSARPYQLRFDKRTIRLYEPQQSPNQNQPALATVTLPEPEIGHYYQCTTTDNGVWLCAKFRLLRDGDETNSQEMFAELVIATREEFVISPPSDIPRRLIQ